MRKVRIEKDDTGYITIKHADKVHDDGTLLCKNERSGDRVCLGCGDFCPFFGLVTIGLKRRVRLSCVNSLEPVLLEVVEEPGKDSA